jgi:septum formation protein
MAGSRASVRNEGESRDHKGNRPALILASASPRRAEILRAAGVVFRVRPAHVDEIRMPRERPAAYVRRLARSKAEAVYRPGDLVLGADTVVVAGKHILGKSILGKPRDAHDAARMLRMLSGRAHDVLTGVCLLAPGLASVRGSKRPGDAASVRCLCQVARTRVWFRRLTRAEIAEYVASGEPMDKAGAYAIQGLASKFVTRIDGCYFNVVGLPVTRVYEMLRKTGRAH